MGTRHLRRLLMIVGVVSALLAVSNTSLVGQEPALPAGRDIVTRYIRAVGGEAAHKAIKSIHAQGTFELVAQNLSGAVELMAARPDKMLLRVEIPQVGRVETGYDGKVGWQLSPISGPVLLTGRRLTETADDAWFDGTLHESDHVKTLTTLAKTTFDNRPAYQVKVVFASGSELTEYFDIETGLILGNEASRDTEMGVLPTVGFTRDYKKFGAILQATSLSQRLIGIEQVLRLTSFEYDTVPANTFDLPPQIKALIK